MKRRPLTKAQLIDRLPRGLRPKLAPNQLTGLGIAHAYNLDDLATGKADEALLIDWVGAVLMWSRVSESIGLGLDEMAEQHGLVVAVIERYKRYGHIGFSGVEYQLAKRGRQVMDELARHTDRASAVAAALWSEAMLQKIAVDMRQPHFQPQTIQKTLKAAA